MATFTIGGQEVVYDPNYPGGWKPVGTEEPTPEEPTPEQPAADDLTRIRTTYFEDLKNLGGDWVLLANYFWTQTASMTNTSDIYTLYKKLFDQGVSGNFNVGGIAGGGIPGIEEEYDPYTAYLQAAGLAGKAYRTPPQEYLRRRFTPISSLYGLQGRLAGAGTPGVGAPGTFQQYLQPFISQPQGVGQSAMDLWRSILGQTPEQRALTETGYEPTFVEGTKTSLGGLGELQTILEEAFRSKYGRPALNWLTGRLPEEQQLFTSRQAAGQMGETFLDYLRKRFAIG